MENKSSSIAEKQMNEKDAIEFLESRGYSVLKREEVERIQKTIVSLQKRLRRIEVNMKRMIDYGRT